MTKTLVEHLEGYDTGFNCVHGRAFDCDPCMERLSKRQRADAVELSNLRAINAHMRVKLNLIVEVCSWVRSESDPLVRVGILALDALSPRFEEVDTPSH